MIPTANLYNEYFICPGHTCGKASEEICEKIKQIIT